MMAIFKKETATIFDWVIIHHPFVVAIFLRYIIIKLETFFFFPLECYTLTPSLLANLFFFFFFFFFHIPQLFDMEKCKPSHD